MGRGGSELLTVGDGANMCLLLNSDPSDSLSLLQASTTDQDWGLRP